MKLCATSVNNFSVKMDTNAFVINEIAHIIDPSATGYALEKLQNEVAVSISESGIHKIISELANSVCEEAENLLGTREEIYIKEWAV
jgi:hypothetical protein